MTQFKVSVVIPIFNAEKYLVRAIQSVLVQSDVNEVILVEDSSPDNVLEVCIKQALLIVGH